MSRPFELLPFPAPKDYDPAEEDSLFFYKNFAKPLVADFIRIMDTGIKIDNAAVEELRKTIDEVLQSVEERLGNNKLIIEYQNSRLPEAQKKHAEDATKALRDIDYYLKPYKSSDIVHRTWVVNCYLTRINRKIDHKDKWTIADLKRYNIFAKDAFLNAIIEKRDLSNNPTVMVAMQELAAYKLDLWNRPRLEKAMKPVELDPFNPASNKQCSEFFELHGVEPVAFSKDTGNPSWGREALEEVLSYQNNPAMIEVLEAMIDHSYSAIIKNNFLKAFDSFTIDGVLHGVLKLFGAKSFRPTSNSPNLLNAPSSRSIYAKPLKRSFVAPDGMVVFTADLGALEDRVIANLSGDRNKQDIFLKDLDGHSLNACGYFADQISKIMGPNTDNVPYIKEFYRLVEEEKNEELKKIRFNSKAPTFKLAYGGYPDAHKGGVITEEIFDRYHHVLYPGITDYRENYVLSTAKKKGYIHLGLGCRMYASDPESSIRTLNNATIQFWSILTLIAVNELHYRIDQEGLQNEIQITSTIYDSIYTQCLEHPEVLAWLNENMIECMTVQYLEDEVVHNVADGQVGRNWADLIKIPNHATPAEIAEILEELK